MIFSSFVHLITFYAVCCVFLRNEKVMYHYEKKELVISFLGIEKGITNSFLIVVGIFFTSYLKESRCNGRMEIRFCDEKLCGQLNTLCLVYF